MLLAQASSSVTFLVYIHAHYVHVIVVAGVAAGAGGAAAWGGRLDVGRVCLGGFMSTGLLTRRKLTGA